jgi:hypothetical protein
MPDFFGENENALWEDLAGFGRPCEVRQLKKTTTPISVNAF